MGADKDDVILKAAPYAAEFFGTFTLVFTAEWAVLTGAEVGWTVTAIASVLTALVYTCGPISGANFNPAVSLSMGLCGRKPWNVIFGYWLAQVGAAILAGCLCNILLWRAVARGLKDMLFYGWPIYYAGLAEFIYTCMLCFVVLSVNQNGWWFKDNNYYGLATGMVIIAGGYAAGGISGACFNPAISLGYDLALWDPNGYFYLTGTYGLCQLAGAVVAALLFKIIRPKEDEQDQPPLLSRMIAEFLGTYILVLTVGLNIVTRSRVMPWSATGAFMSMAYALYGAAGAFNPAITLGIITSGKWNNHWLEIWEAGNHILSMFTQFAAGILAGLTAGLYCLARYDDTPRWIQVEIGKFATALEYPLPSALTAECFFTAVLVYVFLAIWSKDSLDVTTPTYFGLAIALCITAGSFAAGPVSGGILNPAVVAGISAQGWVNSRYGYGHMDTNWKSCAFYWVLVEFLGGLLGMAVYRVVYRETYIKKPMLPNPIEMVSNKNAQKNDRACGGCTPWNSQNVH